MVVVLGEGLLDLASLFTGALPKSVKKIIEDGIEKAGFALEKFSPEGSGSIQPAIDKAAEDITKKANSKSANSTVFFPADSPMPKQE